MSREVTPGPGNICPTPTLGPIPQEVLQRSAPWAVSQEDPRLAQGLGGLPAPWALE